MTRLGGQRRRTLLMGEHKRRPLLKDKKEPEVFETNPTVAPDLNKGDEEKFKSHQYFANFKNGFKQTIDRIFKR